MANFTGQLRPNEIFAALYNMIISQQVFADNVKGTYSSLVDKARVDGSMYGDSKIYYSTDALESVEWTDDEEAANLLELHRPEPPEQQAIHLDKFRQIRLTVDEYMSKRAWGTEGIFNKFTSVMKGWITDTKRVYDSTLYNTYIGTTESTADPEVSSQNDSVDIAKTDNFGLKVAEKLANVLVDLKDITREYNDYGNLRSYDSSDFIVVWNARVYNNIKNIDLPTIFHKEGLLDKFEQEILPERYFGTVVGAKGSTATTSDDNTTKSTGTIRSLVEKTYEVASLEADPRAKAVKVKDTIKYMVHVFPAEVLPNSVQYDQGEAYTEKQDIAFKIIHKQSVP